MVEVFLKMGFFSLTYQTVSLKEKLGCVQTSVQFLLACISFPILIARENAWYPHWALTGWWGPKENVPNILKCLQRTLCEPCLPASPVCWWYGTTVPLSQCHSGLLDLVPCKKGEFLCSGFLPSCYLWFLISSSTHPWRVFHTAQPSFLLKGVHIPALQNFIRDIHVPNPP